jgi:glycerol-3-phosphate dehydrogenase
MLGRDAVLGRMKAFERPDVLIIGGGINGIGVFHDLSRQGIRSLLVERGDFCSGTSAAPSRLIHGGLRYLETGELSLVRESLVERNRLLMNAPHVVKPIRIWVPLRGWTGGLLDAVGRFLRVKRNPGPKGALVVKLGLVLYDILGESLRTMPRHRFVAPGERLKILPGLAADICAVAEYYDAKVTMPERLGLELLDDAEASCPDSFALSYVDVAGIHDGAIRLRDVISGNSHEVRPRLVVNCTGAWLDRVHEHLGINQRIIGGTKGSHLVLRHHALAEQLSDIMLYFETHDHRICLVYALDNNHVLLGTTDKPTDEPDDPVCTHEEVDYLCAALQEFLPGFSICPDQIVFAYAGVRPLPLTESAVASAISRDHELRMFEPNASRPIPVLSLVGGKWTTYRACAEQISNSVLSRLGVTRRASTAEVSIGGGRDWPADPAARGRLIQEQSQLRGLSSVRVETLFGRYGARTMTYLALLPPATSETMLHHLPTYSVQEITFLATQERVARLEDVVLRRTAIALLGDATEPAIAELGPVVGAALGWTDDRVRDEIAATKQLLAKRHVVKRT